MGVSYLDCVYTVLDSEAAFDYDDGNTHRLRFGYISRCESS